MAMQRDRLGRVRTWAGRATRIAIAAYLLASASGLQAQPPTVKVAQGVLAGKPVEDGTLYAGVPYAAPPVGDLRWKAPAVPARWSGVRDAGTFGPACMQPDLGWNSRDAGRGSEDCLSLNVWVPQTGTAKLPVMVWIHGGAFVGGSGSSPFYNGRAMIRNGVILVTINYRLGVLGFLAHPHLSAESRDHASGNYGIQDQVAALDWVHRNIARFGGDPANVTILGQSAGAISVANLIAIPAARRNFRRAIMQSGTAFGIGMLPPMKDVEQADAGFGAIAELRALPAKDLLTRWNGYAAAAPKTRLAIPVVGGAVIRDQATNVFLAGAARDLPLLVGSNVREIPPSSPDELMATGQRLLGADPQTALRWYQERGDDPAAGDPATQMMTDMQFRCGTVLTARESRASWLYHFFEKFPNLPASAHSAEVFYLFDTARPAPDGHPSLNAGQQQLAHMMAQYWTNFAKTGNPNGAGLPDWPRYEAKEERYIELAAPEVRTAQKLREQACRPIIDHWTGKAK